MLVSYHSGQASSLTMVENICNARSKDFAEVVIAYRGLMLSLSVLNLINSLVASIGNLLVIHALRKSSSISPNLKKLFLSLVFSDLAVGMFAEPLYGVMIAVVLSKTGSKNNSFNFNSYLCPTLITFSYFWASFLACASFLNITAIALDRLLALSLHLRYLEIVTSKRVLITLVCLWATSGIFSAIFVLVYWLGSAGALAIEFIGLFLTAVAYSRIYQVLKYHQNRIQRHLQLQYDQAVELLRERKSAINSFFVYLVFITCYLPNLCTITFMLGKKPDISFVAAYHATSFCILLNSSLNPLIYCWRYREVREIVKRRLKTIFCKSNVEE